ncbi:MAG TPA: AAA family ATPase [Urbifossiella sp.]|nr:AAA family ATPase [Urbifossiella sp.]
MKLVRPDDPDPVRAKLAAARAALTAALIERDDEVDLVLTTLVAGEHALLVGPPGSAKSLLLDAVLALTGGRKFALLLTKFTTPEEVFGPVSLAALRDDRYVRVTTGKLPEAEYAFVDEVWKASSAVLNTLLRILNERVYDPGDGVARPVPLRLCVAASNEWPAPDTGKELAALLDRFVVRKTVAPIRSRAGRQRLLWARDPAPAAPTPSPRPRSTGPGGRPSACRGRAGPRRRSRSSFTTWPGKGSGRAAAPPTSGWSGPGRGGSTCRSTPAADSRTWPASSPVTPRPWPGSTPGTRPSAGRPCPGPTRTTPRSPST